MDTSDVLHSVEDNRILAHPQIVIAAPNIDLFLDRPGVRDGELGCEAVDVVEVAIALV